MKITASAFAKRTQVGKHTVFDGELDSHQIRYVGGLISVGFVTGQLSLTGNYRTEITFSRADIALIYQTMNERMVYLEEEVARLKAAK